MKLKEFGPGGGACIPGTPLRSANDYIALQSISDIFMLLHPLQIAFLLYLHEKVML